MSDKSESKPKVYFASQLVGSEDGNFIASFNEEFIKRVQYGKRGVFQLIDKQAYESLQEKLRVATEIVRLAARETKRDEQGCSGSHTQYSQMSNDRICPKCGDWEDGPGKTIIVDVPTWLAKRAIEALQKIEAQDE